MVCAVGDRLLLRLQIKGLETGFDCCWRLLVLALTVGSLRQDFESILAIDLFQDSVGKSQSMQGPMVF